MEEDSRAGDLLMAPENIKLEDALIKMEWRALEAEGECYALKAQVRILRKALEYVWGELDDCEPRNIARFHEARRMTSIALKSTEVGE